MTDCEDAATVYFVPDLGGFGGISSFPAGYKPLEILAQLVSVSRSK